MSGGEFAPTGGNFDPQLTQFGSFNVLVLPFTSLETLEAWAAASTDLPPEFIDSPPTTELSAEERGAYDFLRYAALAAQRCNIATGEPTYGPNPDKLGFTYDGGTGQVTYICDIKSYRDQPGPSYVLTSMRSGATIEFWGTEACNVASQNVTLLGNFAGRAWDMSDPLTALDYAPSEPVRITTQEQLHRLVRLVSYGKHVLEAPHLDISLSTTEDLLYAARCVREGTVGIDHKVAVDAATPNDRPFKPSDIQRIREGLDLPHIGKALLESVQKFTLQSSNLYTHHADIKSALNELITDAVTEVARDGGDTSGRILRLLSKLDLEPQVAVDFFYKNLAEFSKSLDSYPEQKQVLYNTIYIAFPGLQARIIERLREQHIGIAENTNLADLVDMYTQLTARATLGAFWARSLRREDADRRAAIGDAIATLAAILQTPGFTPTEDQKAALTAAGADPDMLPYAIRAVSDSAPGHEVEQLDAVVYMLKGYSMENIASEYQSLDAITEQLSELTFLNPEAQALLKRLAISGREAPRPTSETVTAVSELIAELPGYRNEQESQNETGQPLAEITVDDIINLLAKTLKPDFAKIFDNFATKIEGDSLVCTVPVPGGDIAGPGAGVPVNHRKVVINKQEFVLAYDRVKRWIDGMPYDDMPGISVDSGPAFKGEAVTVRIKILDVL